MYDKISTVIKDRVEIRKHYTGRYGAPGLPRGKKRKKTPEDVARQNYWRKCRELRQTIELNFGADDFHVVLTCRKEERPEAEEAVKIIRMFRDRLRAMYRKEGWELKYIITCETGQHGAVHWHMIVNGMHSGRTTTEKIIRKLWTMGRPYFSPLDDSGDYKKLAEYIVKETSRRMEEGKTAEKLSYMSGRNLIRPSEVTRTERIRSSRWRKKPHIPDGYVLVPDSLVNGVNRYTGLPYQYYTIRKEGNNGTKSSQPVHSVRDTGAVQEGREVSVYTGDNDCKRPGDPHKSDKCGGGKRERGHTGGADGCP